MTIASRLSLFLPCCLLLFSIPASADAQMVVRKKPGRTTYSKTASGVTDGNEDDIVTAYSHTNSRGQTYYEDSGPDDSRGGNLRGSITVNLVNVKDAPAGSDIGPVGWDIGPVGSDVGLAGWDIGPVGSDVGLVGWDVGPVGWDVGPVGSDVDSDKCNCRVVRKNYLPCPCSEEEEEEGTDGASPGVDSDLGAVAIEYAMMASLMGYSDSEAIEYGIVVAIIHEGTGQVISPRDAASGLPTGKR